MIKVGAVILCVPSRYHMAKHVAQNIQLPSIIYSDTTHSGNWEATKRAFLLALRTYGKDYSHILFIQEDLEPCGDFGKSVEVITELLPDKTISLFNLHSDIRFNKSAERRNSSWTVVSAGITGPTILMPRSRYIEFLLWEAKYCSPKMPYEETRLWGFNKVHNIHVWISIPNLVEHLGAMNSALGFNNAKKVSANCLTPQQSGLSIDWSKGIEDAENHILNNDWVGWSKYFTKDLFFGTMVPKVR